MAVQGFEVPEDLEMFLTVEDCSNFPIKRYLRTPDQKQIFEDIKKVRRTTEEMRALGLPYINATLLYGPPGTGKTTFGRYVAYKLGLPFAFINFANLVGGIMGDTARNITKIFRFMEGRNCIFMMDELDCITIQRGNESSVTGGELSRITVTVMQEFDRYKAHGVDTILIAATNVVEKVDPALMSRFAIRKLVTPWNNEYKEKYALKFLNALIEETGAKIDYDPANIHMYCTRNSTLQQRGIEADIIRCIAAWIENGKKGFFLDHIKEK